MLRDSSSFRSRTSQNPFRDMDGGKIDASTYLSRQFLLRTLLRNLARLSILKVTQIVEVLD